MIASTASTASTGPARAALLWPPPQRCAVLAAQRWSPPPGLRAALRKATARPLRPEDPAAPSLPGVALRVDPGDAALAGRAQSYTLRVDARGALIVGADEAGLRYGLHTLLQWLDLGRAVDEPGATAVCGLRVEDWPDLLRRGAMLDVSRDKVPTMRTLRALVDRLAGWKLNELQLYTEHTFAYAGHERVWQHASPLTADEARELDAYCRARGVELVPNQNSFGHLHRWLIHEPYRRLAECPQGVAHPFSDSTEPFSLCPTDPGSLALLGELYDELLPCFASDQLNVGLDETFDLGLGRSRAACELRGKHEVYLDFLCAVHELVRARGHRMQFWGDIVLERPELIHRVPREAIALVWGYEADHPFDEQLARVAAAGLAFYACPGTSSWNSVAGRVENALRNLAAAATAAVRAGAAGYLITDWGDFGHLQPLPVSYPGLLAGAGFSWNAAAAADPAALPLAELLATHALGDAVLARCALGLGDAYRPVSASARNSSALFLLLRFADRSLDRRPLQGCTAEGLAQALAAVEAALGQLAVARPAAAEAALVADELRWAGALLAFCCRLGQARLAAGRDAPLAALPAALRGALGDELAPLIAQHEPIWLARNREGGRADSAEQLLRVQRLLAR